MTELRELPARVAELGSQIVQLRAEMHSEFSATRDQARAGDEETRQLLRDEFRAADERIVQSLREEIRAGDEETRSVLREEIRASKGEVTTLLRGEIRAGDEETRRLMRVLHENVIDRLTLIQEHQTASSPPRAGARRKNPRKRS